MESEEAIIKATSNLLAEEGYNGLTLGKVAARARASKSTIYRRWPTKEHLIVAAFQRWPTLVPHDRGDVAEELMDLYRQFLRVLHKPPVNGVLPTLIAERAHNPELATVLDPLMEKRREPARFVLRRAIERRQLPKDTDVELAVDAIMSVIVSRLYFMPGDLSPAGMRKLVMLVLRGLGYRSAPPKL